LNQEAGPAYAELAASGTGGEIEKAIGFYKAAATHDPNFAVTWVNLGALQRSAGDLEGSRESLETAVVKADRWGLAWLNLGESCEILDDEACARNAYMKALALHPSWTADPYWQSSSLRQSAMKAANATAYNQAPGEPLTMEEVIRQDYLQPVLGTIRVKIKSGELKDAERLLNLTPYFFIRNDSEKVELAWLTAELAAAKGNRTLAVELGVEARNKYEQNKLNDGNVAGIFVYEQDIYQLETLRIFLVPQVTWMQYPGEWQTRMAELKSWQE